MNKEFVKWLKNQKYQWIIDTGRYGRIYTWKNVMFFLPRRRQWRIKI
jgi:hypothetical protein